MRKSKVFSGTLIALTLLSSMPTIYATTPSDFTQIYVKEKYIKTDVAPETKKSMKFVPVSFIAKELGINIKWEKPNVVIQNGDTKIVLTIDSNKYTKNSTTYETNAIPYISSGRVMVPLRFISEQLGCKVEFKKDYPFDHEIIKIGDVGTEKTSSATSSTSNSNVQFKEISPDKKFEAYIEVYGGDEKYLYIKNTATNDSKEYLKTVDKADWLSDNTLVAWSRDKAKDKYGNKALYIINPAKGISDIFDYVSSYRVVEDGKVIVYYKYGEGDSQQEVPNKFIKYDVVTKQKSIVTAEQIQQYNINW